MGNVVNFCDANKRKGDKPMLSVIDVARYLLTLGSMEHKKLQKLCYYIQVWYLALTGSRLINTEFQAWAHGPVSPELYSYFKEWGGLTIPQITYTPYYSIGFTEESKIWIKSIYDLYKDYTADELEYLTHQEKPWIEARGDIPYGQACINVIDEKNMQKYYSEALNGSNE